MTTLLAPKHVTCIRRAFSLIEVLLAIFILGVGVISIAALFPAGIAQQRASVDDSLGPTVANNAISLLRTKLKPEDFGNFEQFGVSAPRITIAGDFPWLRPGFIFNDDPGTPLDERGAINIFSEDTLGTYDATEFVGGYAGSTPSLDGIPYNRALYDTPFHAGPPLVLISQTERYYPSATQNGTGEIGRPQYVWDCMFRKFQGKVLVAIFVYRVTQPGGGNAAYVVAPNPDNQLPFPDVQAPPLPIRLDLANVSDTQTLSCADGPWHPGGPDNLVGTIGDDLGTPAINEANTIVLGIPANVPYNPDLPTTSWQEPRQWILDQNNNVHRVLSVDRAALDADQEVELVRSVPGVAVAPAPGFGSAIDVFTIGAGANPDVVSDIWYMPVAVRDANNNLLNLTPVYVTVKEL